MKKQGNWKLTGRQAGRLTRRLIASSIVTVEHEQGTVYHVYDHTGQYYGVLDLTDDGAIDLETSNRWQ